MSPKKILIIKHLFDNGKITKESLNRLLKVGRWQFGKYLRELAAADILRHDSLYVEINWNLKTNLLKKLHNDFDISELLSDSNELIFMNLEKAFTVDELLQKTNLSKSTVYRTLEIFEQMGLIKKQIILDTADNDSILMLAKTLQLEANKNE